jgi:hypothetical protein
LGRAILTSYYAYGFGFCQSIERFCLLMFVLDIDEYKMHSTF